MWSDGEALEKFCALFVLAICILVGRKNGNYKEKKILPGQGR